MRILVIGDIHAEISWKKFADIEQLLQSNVFETEYNKYIFLGDYFDSFKITTDKMKRNFYDIIRLKKNYPDKVVLLLGNHELHYFMVPYVATNNYLCTGYRSEIHVDAYEFYKENSNLFQAAYQIDNYLFTHAGVSEGWFRDIFKIPQGHPETKTIAELLNEAFETRDSRLFAVGFSRGGLYQYGGPFWADKSETAMFPLFGYQQVVGHSHVDRISRIEKNETTSITFCDVLQSKNPEPYILEI